MHPSGSLVNARGLLFMSWPAGLWWLWESGLLSVGAVRAWLALGAALPALVLRHQGLNNQDVACGPSAF